MSLLHKTKKYNHIKKKTRKYGKKSSAKKLLSKGKEILEKYSAKKEVSSSVPEQQVLKRLS